MQSSGPSNGHNNRPSLRARTWVTWCMAATLFTFAAFPAFAASRGWLGVTTQATDEDLRKGLDLTQDGLLVNQVSRDSPADRAGLKKGDVILTYNSRNVTEPEALRELVRASSAGRTAALGIWRNGVRSSLNVTLGEVPSSEDDERDFDVPVPPDVPQAPRAPVPPRSEGLADLRQFKDLKMLKDMGMWSDDHGGTMMFAPSRSRGRLGVRIEKLNADLGQALGLSDGSGVLVTEVLEDTPAQKAGIRAGDVIVKIGTESVTSPEELVRAVDDQDGRVGITLSRKGVRRELQVDLERRRRNPEPGQGPQVYRWKTKDDSEDMSDVRAELRQLRQELRELREQMKSDNK